MEKKTKLYGQMVRWEPNLGLDIMWTLLFTANPTGVHKREGWLKRVAEHVMLTQNYKMKTSVLYVILYVCTECSRSVDIHHVSTKPNQNEPVQVTWLCFLKHAKSPAAVLWRICTDLDEQEWSSFIRQERKVQGIFCLSAEDTDVAIYIKELIWCVIPL